MRRARARALALAGATCVALASAARAQTVEAGVEAVSDEVRAGISWSGGRAALSGNARTDLGEMDADVRLTTLRGAARHGGADLVADFTLGRDWSLGAVTLRTEAIGHVFSGATGRMDFAEFSLALRRDIGPLRIGLAGWYAPRQRAIGGDNLHLRAMADAGLPGLPVSVYAGLGYTTGQVNDPRTRRLRPAGSYADWKLGAEYVRHPASFGFDYVGTSRKVPDSEAITPFATLADGDDRLVAKLRFSF